MRIPRIKKGQAIEVLWEDTHIPGVPGWMSESEHAEWVENAGSLVRSVGIYVGKGRSFLQLVGDCDAEDSGEKNYLRPINIGIGFIRKVNILGAV